MTDLGVEENGSIYINQSLCPYYKMLWSWSKKLHNKGGVYCSIVSGGTIKIKIPQHGDFVSVTVIDDFIKHFSDIDFTAFYNRK